MAFHNSLTGGISRGVRICSQGTSGVKEMVSSSADEVQAGHEEEFLRAKGGQTLELPGEVAPNR